MGNRSLKRRFQVIGFLGKCSPAQTKGKLDEY